MCEEVQQRSVKVGIAMLYITGNVAQETCLRWLILVYFKSGCSSELKDMHGRIPGNHQLSIGMIGVWV